jgi:hypothetical protein
MIRRISAAQIRQRCPSPTFAGAGARMTALAQTRASGCRCLLRWHPLNRPARHRRLSHGFVRRSGCIGEARTHRRAGQIAPKELDDLTPPSGDVYREFGGSNEEFSSWVLIGTGLKAMPVTVRLSLAVFAVWFVADSRGNVSPTKLSPAAHHVAVSTIQRLLSACQVRGDLPSRLAHRLRFSPAHTRFAGVPEERNDYIGDEFDVGPTPPRCSLITFSTINVWSCRRAPVVPLRC